ncbi:DUF5602 domain-containing protein [Azospirillum argentinense]|uniref:DUF5602 domain-containing protein n=1 Tax=Azospirillum argentinense TaxID=2970906 RepID=UPI00190BCC92|nr:DUF5602 domain-containing protein [Azospirillum argentinense]MBK3800495.1 hypothetical protein [Azospirillum argentinense]
MLIRTILVVGAFAMATVPAQAQSLDKAPPGGAYKKVSELVKLPDFLPGMGTLYVDPKTLPVGPFLAYDRDGRLASTIYMVPVEDLQAQKKLDDLKTAGGKVDHVDMYFNAGHPGVEKPHYHVVLWHIAEADEARVAK